MSICAQWLCLALGFTSRASAAHFHQLPLGTAVTSLSADGMVAAGTFLNGGAWIWNAADGFAQIPGSDGIDGNVALSADGAIIAGTKGGAYSKRATAAYMKNGKWDELVGLPRPSSAWGMSPDASVVVGLAPVTEEGPYPVSGAVWRVDGAGASLLRSTVAGQACRANVAANGGQWIGGWQDLTDGERAGAVWEAQGAGNWKQRILRDSDGHHVGEVLAMNAMGTVLAGAGLAGRGGWVMFQGQAAPTILANVSMASAIFGASADGTLVGGTAGPVGVITRTGFLWTPDRGVEALLPAMRRLLGDALPMNVSASELGAVTAISADGSTIAGWGLAVPPALTLGPHGWIATIRENRGDDHPIAAEQDALTAPPSPNIKKLPVVIVATLAGLSIGVFIVLAARGLKCQPVDSLTEPILC